MYLAYSPTPANASRQNHLVSVSFLVAIIVFGSSFVLLRSARAKKTDAGPTPNTTNINSHEGDKLTTAYGKLPLSFEANQGQVDQRVRFTARGVGYNLFLTSNEAVLALRARASCSGLKDPAQAADGYKVVRMKLAGANPQAKINGQEELPGKLNYFIGNDPAKWRSDVPLYAKVHYKDIYKGIDLLYYGNQRHLEYDFQVSPGSDPRAIKIQFEGTEQVKVDSMDGSLVLVVDQSEVRLKRPVIYQLAKDGNRREIRGSYEVKGKTVKFRVGDFDKSEPLVIDPILSYSTYLGSSSNEIGWGIAVDASGSAYVSGQTGSFTFPTTGVNFVPADNTTGHAFVSKLDPSGSSLVYSTLIGGSSDDTAFAIALDSAGAAYITGRTSSTNFPTVNAIRSSSNVLKSSDSGANWAPGNSSLGTFTVNDIAIDPATPTTVYAATSGGNGIYKSTDSGATWNGLNTGAQLVAALAINPQTPSTIYAVINSPSFGAIKTVDGGVSWTPISNGLSGTGFVSAIAIDPQVPTTVYAGTFSGVFKSTNAGASWQSSNTGLNFTSVTSFAIDPSSPATVYAGLGGGGVFKTTNAGGNWVQMNSGLTNAFVTALVIDPTSPATVYAGTAAGGVFKTVNGSSNWNPINTGLANNAIRSLTLEESSPSTLYAGTTGTGIFKSVNGGSNWTAVYSGLSSPTVEALAVRPSGVVYAGVDTRVGSPNSDSEAFVTKLNAAGNALVFSTYLGGSGSDEGDGIAVDGTGNVVVTGQTASTDFSLVNPRQSTLQGLQDAFVSKFSAAGNVLIYSTYLGGGNSDGGRAVSVDSSGNAYVTGQTSSSNFPVTPGAFQTSLGTGGPFAGDAFVTKYDSGGNLLIYSTYLGGNSSDQGFAIAVDASGSAFVAGSTSSNNFPTLNPVQSVNNLGGFAGDAFITKLNPAGSGLSYSTYLGGSDEDQARGLAVDNLGNAYVTGITSSFNFPTVAGAVKSKSSVYRTTNAATSWSNDNFGLPGSVSDLAINPLTSVVYAATSKGVFRSTNGGQAWSAINNGLMTLTCTVLAIDPLSPSTIYVGTGNFGTGLFKSTNGGASWSSANGNQSFTDIAALTIDPVNTSTIYLSANFSSFKTIDGGTTWTLIPNNKLPPFVTSFAVNPQNTQEVYASINSSPGGILKSTDGGTNWATVNNGLTTSFVFRIVIDPSNTSTVYAGTNAGVFKTTSGGGSWTISLSNNFVGSVLIDPVTPSTIYASSSAAGSSVLKSINGGTTWVQSSSGISFPAGALAINPQTPANLYVVSNPTGIDQDAFVAKLSPAGNSLLYSTYLGGQSNPGDSSTDQGFGVAVDVNGNAYVTGVARSKDFPVTADAFQPFNRGFDDAFIAKIATSFSISGVVTDGGSTPQSNVKITLTGSVVKSFTTESDGTYQFVNLPQGGSFTVSATKTGFSFTPPSQSFSNINANQTANFTSSPSATPFHTISGQLILLDSITPLVGVNVALTGSQTEFTTTDAAGNYSFSAPDGGNYSVTPSQLGFNFIPPTNTVNNLSANATLNFQAVRLDFVVTNANDRGAGSLRQAMLDANATQGADRVVFNIPGGGVHTIDLKSPLPTVVESVTIDGSTQPGFAGQPLIELNGSGVGLSAHGITITGGGSVIRALVINRFEGSGISLQTGGNNRIEGNIIGLDPTGSSEQPNKAGGISIGSSSSNIIGGTTSASRNVISGNTGSGISMAAANNVIKGNYIGTNLAGTQGRSNSGHGIILVNVSGQVPDNNQIGGTEPGAGNVISGNGSNGIDVSSAGTVIQGNLIGTDATGSSKIANSLIGINVNADNVVIGGTTTSARNIISGNGTGVSVGLFFGTNPTVTLKGNYIGTDITGTARLGNGRGVAVSGRGTVGGTEPGAGNLISGNDGPGIQLNCCGPGSTTVLGNFIGTDATGMQALGNLTGVSIQSSQNVIGGSELGARNVISGNNVGIQVGGQSSSVSGNVIKGNLIGVDVLRTTAIPNTLMGIFVSESSNTVIGGDQSGEGNIIAFNGSGIQVSSRSLNSAIRGNSVFSSIRLGLDLNSDDVVTPNDPGDADEGANHLQNFPVLSSITTNAGSTNVKGSLNSNPNTQFRLDFYTNLACDASGNGEGARPFGSTQITTDGTGNAAIDVNLPAQLGANNTLTATATDPLGNTSEFSSCNSAVTAGSVEFSALNLNTLEDVGNAVIHVVRTGGSKGTLAVTFGTSNGTATAGSDYTATSGTLTFGDGETEKIFTIPIANDSITEPEETVNLTLSGTSDLESLGGKSKAVLHIFDASTPLTLTFDAQALEDVSFAEGNIGNSNAKVTVRLSAQTNRTVSVDFATLSGFTATPGTDFVPVTGTLTFTPGTETKDILIPIIGDTIDEVNETLGLDLSNPSNATLPFSTVVLTILDDDPQPGLSVTDVSVAEGSAVNAFFSVRLSAQSGRTVFVNFATANGTASAGSDYTSTSGSLVFSPGETVKTVAVPILTDGIVEPAETFFLNLSNAQRATVADGQGLGTIIDSSATTSLVQFSASSFSANESDGQVPITVMRSGDVSQAASVDYQTVSQSASERSDFTASLGTLRFAPGDISKTFTVLITDDVFLEPIESLDLILSNPNGASLGGPNVASLTITSNDVADGASPVSEASFDTSFFVRQHYHDFLNREPDAAGLNFWINVINSCQDAQCREVTKINVSASFFLSIEFQETGYLVYRTYKAAYGDTNSPNVQVPVPIIRLQEFLPDTQRIGQGVQVGIGNWEQQLEANKNAYMLEFVQRQRFLNAFSLSLTPTQFVDKLNLNSGGVLSQAERDQFIAELTAAIDVNQGRASIVRKVAEDVDMRRNESNRAFVLMEYYGYLRRNPDDPQDTDFRGWDFWLTKLNQFNGNFVNAEMVKAFITSIEYTERFGR